jgi:hypothetical protein
MKVTRNTPDQLIISDTPWFIGIMLTLFILVFVGAGLLVMTEAPVFGFIWMAFGAGMGIAVFAVFVRRVQIILDRPSNSIKIRRQSIFRYQSVEHQLDELGEAVLETTTSRDRDSGSRAKMTRPVLVFASGMSAGCHPMVEAFSTGQGSKIIVDAINTWHEALLDSSTREA